MTWTRLGGVAAVLGGLAWSVKGFVILVGGDQPPVLFEIAPMFFGVALLSMAQAFMPTGRRRVAGMVAAVVAVGSGVVAAVTEVVGEVAGAAIAASSLALVIGLVVLDHHRLSPTRPAWWLGVAMIPAVFVGGMLSEIDERLLELPLVGLGVGWMYVGWAVLAPRVSSRETAG